MLILFISAHTDDIELGCGGTVSKMVRVGYSVRVWAFGYGNSVNGATRQEFLRSMAELSVSDFKDQNFACRTYHERRQDILQEMMNERRIRRPDIVFVPNSGNAHQDHEVITNEALRAYKTSSILGYELPWGDMRQVQMPFFVRLTEGDLEKKCRAVARYTSQKTRPYTNDELLYSLATVRGAQAGLCKYAEAFEVLRWIW